MIAKRVTGVFLSLGDLSNEIYLAVSNFMHFHREDKTPLQWYSLRSANYEIVVCRLFWNNFQLPIRMSMFDEFSQQQLVEFVYSQVPNLDKRFYQQCEAARLMFPETDVVVVCEHQDVYLIEK